MITIKASHVSFPVVFSCQFRIFLLLVVFGMECKQQVKKTQKLLKGKDKKSTVSV